MAHPLLAGAPGETHLLLGNETLNVICRLGTGLLRLQQTQPVLLALLLGALVIAGVKQDRG